MRLIDVDALEPKFIHGRWEETYVSNKELMDAPTIDAEPIKHGHWINTGSGEECSVCREIQYGYDSFRSYCANCGTKMDEVDDETS